LTCPEKNAALVQKIRRGVWMSPGGNGKPVLPGGMGSEKFDKKGVVSS